MIISKFIYVPANGIISFFLQLSNILLYVYQIFIHSPVNGHLGCFHVLTLLNTASVDIGVHIFFKYCFGVMMMSLGSCNLNVRKRNNSFLISKHCVPWGRRVYIKGIVGEVALFPEPSGVRPRTFGRFKFKP